MLLVNGGDNNVSISANNTDSVTNSATALAARTLIINGNEGEGSDNLSFFAMADGTGNYGMEVSNSAHTAQYDLLINPIMGGNVGIGTTSPAAKLHVAAATGDCTLLIEAVENSSSKEPHLQLKGTNTSSNPIIEFGDSAAFPGTIEYENSDNSMRFGTNAGERMRILSNGAVCIGTTDTGVDTSNGAFVLTDGRIFSNIPANSSGFNLRHDSNNRFFVTHVGVINAQTTSISGISDERLKENIVDLETGLTEVLALKPRRFNWVEAEKVPTKNIAGFVAQEVETVLPDLIGSYKHDRIDNAKSLKMGDMIPTLVKAIQEQQTIIEDLKTRIETLEG